MVKGTDAVEVASCYNNMTRTGTHWTCERTVILTPNIDYGVMAFDATVPGSNPGNPPFYCAPVTVNGTLLSRSIRIGVMTPPAGCGALFTVDDIGHVLP